MNSALKNFDSMNVKNSKKHLILGDMLRVREDTLIKLHKAISSSYQ